jgi:hypothetical protein
MKKIGLQMGENTGINLNKMIQKKPNNNEEVPKTPVAPPKNVNLK